MLRCWWLFY